MGNAIRSNETKRRDLADFVVRAIDVGYGNTKYVMHHEMGKDVICKQFPSLAPQAASNSLSVGMPQRLNTVTVEVEGIMYEVGRDANLAQDASHGRILDSTYPASATYLALVRGALAYMMVPEIDLLVVGLPISNFSAYKDTLIERLTGTHKIPSLNNADEDGKPGMTEVVVHSVRVFPQALGAFLDHSIRNKVYDNMKEQTNLMIDPGYFTLDWFVAHGMKSIEARSGGVDGGMSAILAAIAESIGKKLKANITDLSEIDRAMRTGTNPVFWGNEFTEFADHIKAGKAKASQFASVLANKVGKNGIDIQNIILSGGGATFFQDVIQDKFPRHKLIVAHDPIYSNVRGFQIMGEQWMQRKAVEESRRATSNV